MERWNFIFASGERPDFPAVHAIAVADGTEGIKVIIRDDILLPRLAVNRKHHDENLVARQAVFNRAVKREDSGVVQIRISRRVLRKINREKCAARFRGVVCFLSAGKADELKKLPAPFLPVLHSCQQRIQKIVVGVFDGRIANARKKRWKGPGVFILGLLRIIKRSGSFGAITRFQREIETIKNKSKTVPAIVRFSGIRLLTKTREQENKCHPQTPAAVACRILAFIRYRYSSRKHRFSSLKVGVFNIEIDFDRLSPKFILIEVFASVPPDPVLVQRCQHWVFYFPPVAANGPSSSTTQAKKSALQSCTSQCRRT